MTSHRPEPPADPGDELAAARRAERGQLVAPRERDRERMGSTDEHAHPPGRCLEFGAQDISAAAAQKTLDIGNDVYA